MLDSGGKLLVFFVSLHLTFLLKAYPWYYVIDSDIEGGKKVVDVWVAWKGW